LESDRAIRLHELADARAAVFSEAVGAAARESRNEREFQRKVGELLASFAKEVGVDLLSREEYTLATGRADAVYNRLIIEYEAPRSLRPNPTHRRTAHAIQQTKDYIEGVAKRERHAKERLLGLAFDGTYLIFVRFRESRWDIEPALEWDERAAARLLRSLVSLSSGRALIPENLVEDFGAQNIYSQRVTRALYHALEDHEDDLVDALFQQWRVFFSEVSGYEEAAAQLQDKKELRQFARGMGLRSEIADPARLFFAIHTYFSFLAKAIARLVLERYASGSPETTPLTVLAGLDGNSLRHELERLEDGGIFQALGFVNLLEGDFFGWYLSAWSDEVKDALQLTLRRLAEYNPATIEEDPYAARDLLKKVYHYLMPREIRHDLGEYYTPDWLAARLLRQLGEPLYIMPENGPAPKVDFSKRLVDPACGSGTFLILAIRAIKEHARRQGFAEADTLELILNGVVGIDLNPLAVLAARVGYLLAIAELVPYRRHPIVLPVYLADSIVTPTEGATLFEHGRALDTVVARFPVPERVDSAEAIGKLTDVLHDYVQGGFSTESFLQRMESELRIDPKSQDGAVLQELYECTLELKRRGKDGIWARILKNAFMPLFIGRFDYVAGNPPWVNWESLPGLYRQRSASLWQDYGLFVHSGMDTILGKGKKDISTLMTYVVIDRFLKPGGVLGFVITQSVFKTAGAGQGFRRFRLPDGTPLRVKHVDDMSELRPFERAANRTTVVVIQKGMRTRYPVPYTYWRKTVRGKGLGFDSSLDEVIHLTSRRRLAATPVQVDDPTSPWLTATPRAAKAIRKVLGPSSYEAHAGVYSGGANAVYWVDIVGQRPDGVLVVQNVVEGARRRAESVTAEIEGDVVYPLVRGRDVRRWSAHPSINVLMVQDPKSRRGIAQATLRDLYPRTYAYLQRFERVLRERAAFKRYFAHQLETKNGEEAPYYSMFDVGEYTFSPYKVVWPWIAARIRAAVISTAGEKLVLPENNVTFCAFSSRKEAHFFCGALNSTPASFAIRSIYAAGGGGIARPGVLRYVHIPSFDPDDPKHQLLSRLSERAHAAEAKSDGATILDLERQIDEVGASLWGLSEAEVEEMGRGHRELLNEEGSEV
jgi:hypothetical protein